MSSATPTGLHFDVPNISENTVDTEVGSIECLTTESSATFTLDNAGEVPFELSPVMNSNIAKLIRTAELDYETGPDVYELQVTCSDSLGSKSDRTTVAILPVNEYSPVLSPSHLTVHISEVTPAGTVLASQSDPQALVSFAVSDQDRGVDGVLRFRFSPPTNNFEINETDGTIVLSNTIDFDRNQTRTFPEQVLVCDGDRAEILCRTWVVDVVVASVNEFTPKFTQPTYSTADQEYSEGDYIDKYIATVFCTDADADVGALDGIELVETSAPLRLVRVSSEQANVFLNGSLDSEMIRSQELHVELICSDTGDPPKSATATLIIHVKGVDDNLPQFTQPLYEAEVSETLSVGSQVVGIACTDQDYGAGDFEGISLLNPSSKVAQTFDIDPKTGSITLKEKLDFDAGPESYQFFVVCSDSAGNRVMARVDITMLPAKVEKVPTRATTPSSEYGVRGNLILCITFVVAMAL